MNAEQERGVLSCPEVLERHSDFIDGMLAPHESDAIRAHLAACADCARYDRVLRRGVALLTAADADAECDFLEQLHVRIAEEEERLARRPISSTAAASVSVAAVLALCAWIPFMLLSNDDAAEASVLTPVAAEIAWRGELVPPGEPHRQAPRRIKLVNAHPHVSEIDRGYTPLILEAPTAPPTYSTVTLTSLHSR